MSIPWAFGRLVGAVLWSFATISARANLAGTTNQVWLTGGQLLTAPAVAPDGSVYVGDVYNLRSYSPTGSVNWTLKTLGGWIGAAAAIGTNGHIYVPVLYTFAGSGPGRVYGVTPEGVVTNKWQCGGRVPASPSIGPDGAIYIGDELNNVYSFSPAGPTNWVITVGGKIQTSAAVGPNDTLYVGCSDGKLYALNTADGGVTQTWQTSGSIRSCPVLGADGTVYVGSTDSNFYTFLPDGTTSTVWKTGGQITASATMDERGMIYVPSDDGILYGFQTTNKLAASCWPTFSHDIHNSGGFQPFSSPAVAATDGVPREKIVLVWDTVANATSYDVWRGTNDLPAEAALLERAWPMTNYDDLTAEQVVNYRYWIRSRNAAGAGPFATFDAGVRFGDYYQGTTLLLQ